MNHPNHPSADQNYNTMISSFAVFSLYFVAFPMVLLCFPCAELHFPGPQGLQKTLKKDFGFSAFFCLFRTLNAAGFTSVTPRLIALYLLEGLSCRPACAET